MVPRASPPAVRSDMLALGGITRRFGSDERVSVADTQACLPVPADPSKGLSQLITCLSEVQAWVTSNFFEA